MIKQSFLAFFMRYSFTGSYNMQPCANQQIHVSKNAMDEMTYRVKVLVTKSGVGAGPQSRAHTG